MKVVTFGIFAHPDDEAFGPSGVLLDEVKKGNEVHLITLTLGEMGNNPDNVANLGGLREKEWREAGGLIGASSMHYLGYKDSQLDNTCLVDAQSKLTKLIADIVDSYPEDVLVDFMIADTNGITGHIDHIVASRASLYAFYKLKENDARYRKVRATVLSNKLMPKHNIDWLYMEKGRDLNQIDEVIDTREYHDEIVEIMRCHNSQRSDVEYHLKLHGEDLGMYYFKILR